MECREGYEQSSSGACVPVQLFDTQLFSRADQVCKANERPAPLLPTCEIVETCSPKLAAKPNQCSPITAERETAQCTQRVSTDTWGRKRVDETNCGQSQPYKITLTPKGEKPIEFFFDGKEYRADYRNAKGEKIGHIGYSLDQEYVYYHNDKTHISFTDMKDGTHVVKKLIAEDQFEITMSKDGKPFYFIKKDKTGKTETSNYADGSSMTAVYKGGSLLKETIKHADGTITNVKKSEDGSLEGTHRDRHNKVIEDVVLVSDYPMHKPGSDDPDAEYLVFRNRKDGSQRAVAMPADIKHDHSARFQPLAYDGNLGTLALTTADGNTIYESTQGRTDVKSAKGVIVGSTITGEQSYLWPDGDSGAKRAMVMHPDGCGAQLNADETIDRWCKEIEDKAINEKLEPTEKTYLKKHVDIVDQRDFLEIHRRFRADEKELHCFYEKLSQIDSIHGLSNSEKEALSKNLMHHVAYPDEIVQGRSPTCNVAVLEIEMAKLHPNKYVDFVVDAIAKDSNSASYRAVGGKTVRFDDLKMTDLSGRDLASRVFQTAALQLSYYPQAFRNTADGTGKILNGKSKETFDGLEMEKIAELRYQLTGEETAQCWVTSLGDLEKALALSKGKPIIVSVDARKAPFHTGDEKSDRKGPGAHVVLVNSIENGPPAKVKITNPWGPSVDHKDAGSTISGDDLIKNMLFEGDKDFHYGVILVSGPRGKIGTIMTGKFEPL